MLSVRKLLDLLPLFIGPKLSPSSKHRLLIGPRQQIYELRAVIRFRLPRSDDVKAVGLHDPRRMVAKSVMKRSLVLLEDFVNSELMDHLHITSDKVILACWSNCLVYSDCPRQSMSYANWIDLRVHASAPLPV